MNRQTINHLIQGLEPGQLKYLLARTGAGKSLLIDSVEAMKPLKVPTNNVVTMKNFVRRITK